MVETLANQKVRRRSRDTRHHTGRTHRLRRIRLPGNQRHGADAPRVLTRQLVRRGVFSNLKLPHIGVSEGSARGRGAATAKRRPGLEGFGARVERRLDKLAETVFRRFSGMDLAVVAAAVGALFALNMVLAPSQAFSRAVTRPSELDLPEASQHEEMLTAFLNPPNEYDVIGGTATVDPSRFQSVEVRKYELKPGDTLLGLALRFDLNMDTIISFNQIEDVRLMRFGEVYDIPNRDGLLYEVKQGDSLASIADRYDTRVNAILDANDLASSRITPDEVIFIPNARMSETELKLILGELFLHPMRGRFTSGFGMRNDPFTGIRRMHYGIDVASGMGTPVKAARAGRVAHIESQIGNYGKFIILRHPGGYQSLYAHLDSFNVRVGQYVSQGQVIGRMGNTGRSTGPHLHFSIIKNGAFVDPMDYLH